jgi:hypothetical protein
MAYENIIVDTKCRVGLKTLNRPKILNLLKTNLFKSRLSLRKNYSNL